MRYEIRAASFIGILIATNCAYAQNNSKIQGLDKVIKELGRFEAVYGKNPERLPIEKRIQLNKDAIHVGLEPKVIYGVVGADNRKNYYEASDAEKRASASVSVMVKKSKLLSTGVSGFYNLPAMTANLCDGEKFNKEPAPGSCTAFRVGKNLIATAGHCIRTEQQCNENSFVFDFKMNSATFESNKNINSSRIYHCKEVVNAKLDPAPRQTDYSILRVDRDIDDSVPIVILRREGNIDIGDEITVVGHPIGLPLKVTPRGIVRRHDQSFFVGNPDTYGGNSGSPVFNSRRLENGELFVEGILVRGETDFTQDSPCRKSNVCEENACRGEDVTYSREFASFVP